MLIPRQPFHMQQYRRRNPYVAPAIATAIASKGLYSLGKSMYNRYMYGQAARQASNIAKTLYQNKKKAKAVSKAYRKVAKKNNPINKLKRDVKRLKIKAEGDQGTLVYRYRGVGRILASINSNAMQYVGISGVSTLEAVIANLKYYDPSAPTTLVTADFASGSFQKEVTFSKIYGKVTVRNNYQVPCKVKLYVCRPKEDTSISPIVCYTNGLTDMGAPTSTSTLMNLTDSDEFNSLWNIIKSSKHTLLPGQEASIIHSGKLFQYDPSFVDDHTLSFQARFDGAVVVIRVEGVLGHDTSANEQARMQAGVDYESYILHEVQYSAGADIKYYVLSDNASASFTNGGVCSSMPVADNIGYSVA